VSGRGSPGCPGSAGNHSRRGEDQIGRWAEEIGNQYARHLLDGIWRRELRNAVFHADYTLHGSEIRLVGDGEVFTLEEFGDLSGRAHAFHDSMIGLRRYYRGLYTEPRLVPAGPISGVVVGPTVGYPPSRLPSTRGPKVPELPCIGAYPTGSRRSVTTFSPCKTTTSLCQLAGIAPRRSPVRNPASSQGPYDAASPNDSPRRPGSGNGLPPLQDLADRGRTIGLGITSLARKVSYVR
jgi:hypothetical protein